MKNYYEILEVDRHASLKVIKGVYKLHIKENHPDLFQGEEKLRAEEKLKEFNEAYEVLSDEFKRQDYDKALDDEYENEITLLKEENETLKNALMHENENIAKSFRENNFLKYQENNVNDEEYKMEEYEPDENVTYENNSKYITKLARKEFLLKIVITICIVIAAAIGLYRSTGFNLFDVFWKALTAVFK